MKKILLTAHNNIGNQSNRCKIELTFNKSRSILRIALPIWQDHAGDELILIDNANSHADSGSICLARYSERQVSFD